MNHKLKQTVAALTLLAFSTTAWSSGRDEDYGSYTQSQQQTVNSANTATNTVTSANTLQASPSVNFTQPSTITLKNTPNVVAPNVYPSANCHGSTSGGFAVAGLGISGGSSWRDPDCGIRETARLFDGMGLREDAIHVLCSSPLAAAAPSCKARGGTSGR